jgi:nitrogenase molybdenum-iron protein alpha/beta subunit
MPSRLGVRINIPYLQGAYLALNAIPDACFLGDGPSCIFAKAEQIHGRHDLFSTLLSCDNAHRVQHTGVNVFNIAGDCEGIIAAALRRTAALPGCGVVFLGAMPMCSIAGTDYDRVLREALAGSHKPAFVMPRRSAISGDWLDGYAGVLEALARGMDLSGARPRRGRVALVGYLMDRNEGDHWGNLAELERLFAALGLKAASIWLSGRPYEELRRVRQAEVVVSLPHGRAAARILAKRLGVRLIEAELPFGLEASRRFMEQLGRELGRESRAGRVISSELAAVAPRLQWSVPHAFLHRRFAFAGDPHYALGFVEQIEGLGGRVTDLLLMGQPGHLAADQRRSLESRPGAVFEPLPYMMGKLCDAVFQGEVDLLVGNGFAFREVKPGLKWMEFGFPSECTHFLREEPFLGFQGALAFLSRAANELVKGLVVRPPAGPEPGEEDAIPPSRARAGGAGTPRRRTSARRSPRRPRP